MLQMQAAIVCSNLVSYTLLPMVVADLMNSMRKKLLVQSAEAGVAFLAVETRMWELLPAFLMVATISALVVEVWHPPFSWCLMVHPACFSTGLLCPNKLYMHVSQLAG